uniref:Uncharacterized protein n=1 Tax=Romanomermis culicivorax TaxID=13658 RepID=A0A915KDT7_ROMCU
MNKTSRVPTLGSPVATKKALVLPGWSKSCIAPAVYKAMSSKADNSPARPPALLSKAGMGLLTIALKSKKLQIMYMKLRVYAGLAKVPGWRKDRVVEETGPGSFPNL